jgi:hypothetical protein
VSAALILPALAKVSAAEVLKIVGESKILSADSSIQAAVRPSEKAVEISATREARATDKDCKIDAVLIARKVMDADPDGVAKVKVTFLDASDQTSYRQVTVRAGDVKAFAARAISQEMLLSELELVSGRDNTAGGLGSIAGTAQPEVGPGVLPDERAALLAKIQDLQKKGVGTGPFLAIFKKVEEAAGKGESVTVSQLIGSLGKAVDEQAEHLRHLRQEQKVRPVPLDTSGKRLSRPEAQKLLLRSSGELGELTPGSGPFPVRRLRVAHKLKELQRSGRDTKSYFNAYRQLEALVRSGDGSRAEVILQQLEGSLGLPSIKPPRLTR